MVLRSKITAFRYIALILNIKIILVSKLKFCVFFIFFENNCSGRELSHDNQPHISFDFCVHAIGSHIVYAVKEMVYLRMGISSGFTHFCKWLLHRIQTFFFFQGRVRVRRRRQPIIRFSDKNLNIYSK